MAIAYNSEALPSVTEAARLLGGEAAGDRVLCPGPGHRSRDRSLSVRFDPNAPGGYLVHSYASDDWSACRDYVRERLGLAPWGGPPQAQSRNCLPPAHPARLATLVAHDDFAARTDAAMRIWGETVRLSGRLGERYLVEHRKLDIAALSLGHALRWHLGIQALVALMTDPASNEPVGIHRTFLESDGTKRERKMLGRQGAIRLSPDDSVTMGLGLTEGVEDGLAVLLSGWNPVWAATSAGAIARFPVLPGIDSLTLFADSDAAGLKAAEACKDRWSADGREVVIAQPGRLA